jgi:hypothetical protein
MQNAVLGVEGMFYFYQLYFFQLVVNSVGVQILLEQAFLPPLNLAPASLEGLTT